MRRRIRASGVAVLLAMAAACGDTGGAPGLIGKVSKASSEADRQSAETQLVNFRSAIRMHLLRNRGLPDSLDDLLGTFLDAEAVPLDPWGNAYVYAKTGEKTFELKSLGADGAEGGEGFDADIVLR